MGSPGVAPWQRRQWTSAFPRHQSIGAFQGRWCTGVASALPAARSAANLGPAAPEATLGPHGAKGLRGSCVGLRADPEKLVIKSETFV